MKSFIKILVLVLFSFGNNLNSQSVNNAIVLSQSGKYEAASIEFELILKSDSNNINTLIAAGYNMAWAGNYRKALNYFSGVLKLNPNNYEAQKGIAYVHLYNQHYRKALYEFKQLKTTDSSAEDIQNAIGITQMNMEKYNASINTFKQILRLNPNNTEAKLNLSKLQDSKNKTEILIIAGHTSTGNLNKFDLIQAQISFSFFPNHTVYIKTDKSIGLNNYELLRQKINANFHTVGNFIKWNALIAHKFEYSVLKFNDGKSKSFGLAEQYLYIHRNHLIKLAAGAELTRSADKNIILMFGIKSRVSKSISIEPQFFQNFTKIRSFRYVINISIKPLKNLTYNFSYFYGNANISNPSVNTGIQLLCDYRFNKHFNLITLLRKENDTRGIKSILLSGGCNIRL